MRHVPAPDLPQKARRLVLVQFLTPITSVSLQPFMKNRKAGIRSFRNSTLCALIGLSASLHAAQTPLAAAELQHIPLVHVKSAFADEDFDSLGIMIGINGGKPHLFEFDTGSDQFNLQMSSELQGVSPVPGTMPKMYGYGDGTYGYWVQKIQFDRLSYFDPKDLTRPVATFDGGYIAARILDAVYTRGYHSFSERNMSSKAVGRTSSDTPLFADLDIRRRIQNDQPGETPPFFGVFGASNAIGEEIETSAIGGRTKSGYVIAANANMGDSKTPGCAPCMTLHLNPSIRAQFSALMPWGEMDYSGQRRQFPLSGTHASSIFEGSYQYTITITVGKKKKDVEFRGPIMFDTGTSEFLLVSQDGVLKKLNAKGLRLKKSGDETVGFKMYGSGDKLNDLEFEDVEIHRQSDEDEGDGIVVGLPFFQSNALLYDLENRTTGYAPHFVTAMDFSTTPGDNRLLHLGKVTAEHGSEGWLGLAGNLSGIGDFIVEKDAVVRMTGTNTYSGITRIADGGFIHLAGPGSIANSSRIVVEGALDISQKGNRHKLWGVADTDNDASIRDLSGKGEVHIGTRRLIITAANGRFDGDIMDYDGENDGLGGGLTLSGGRLTLAGENDYKGVTIVDAGAELVVSGSLTGDVIVSGKLIVDGEISGTVRVENGGAVTGSGKAGKVTVAQGGSAVKLKTRE